MDTNQANVEVQLLACYKGTMVRGRKAAGEKKLHLIGAMAGESLKLELQEIADQEERTLSFIAEAFIRRGLAAYKRDHQLREPDKSIYERPVIKVQTEEKRPEQKTQKEESKKRRA